MLERLFVTMLEVSATTGLIILALKLLSPVLREYYTSTWKYWVWLVLAVRLLTPVNLSFLPVAMTIPEVKIAELGNTTAMPMQPEMAASLTKAAQSSFSLLGTAIAVWLIGCLCYLLYQTVGYRVFKKEVLRWSRAVQDERINRCVKTLLNEMGIITTVDALISEKVSSPMIIGLFNPLLLLPHDNYAETELQFILKHEFTHLKRHDLWYKLLLVLVNALHWFNPLVYLLTREANADLELSCDDQVLKGRLFAERRAYGETILASIQKQSARKTVLSTYFYGGTKLMKERFQNILSMKKKRQGIVGLLLVLICLAVIGGCTLSGDPDVEAAYARACEAFGWFHLTTMPLSDQMETQTYNGQTYLKVDHPEIHNMSELKSYLQSLFTDDIVNALLDESSDLPRYRDFDNVLYALPADRGTDITKGEATYEIVRENKHKIVYRVTVELLDLETQEVTGYERYNFPYEKINGQWLFSDFQLIY